MNKWGVEGCRENLERIVEHLLKEASRRNWRLEGRRLLSLAARIGTRTPWGRKFAEAWARKLVVEAIELTERTNLDAYHS